MGFGSSWEHLLAIVCQTKKRQIMAVSSTLLGHVAVRGGLSQQCSVTLGNSLEKDREFVNNFRSLRWIGNCSKLFESSLVRFKRREIVERASFGPCGVFSRMEGPHHSQVYFLQNLIHHDVRSQGTAPGRTAVTTEKSSESIQKGVEDFSEMEEDDEEGEDFSDDEWDDEEDDEDEEDTEDEGGLSGRFTEIDDDEDDYIRIGIISGVHGLRGDLRVHSLTDFPEERFQKPGIRWLRRPGMKKQPLQEVKLVKGRPGPGKRPRWLIRFKGISSVELATELVGSSIMVAADDRPSLEEGEFYTQDLVGLNVVLKGEIIGNVVDIFETGASDLLQVRLSLEDRLVLVPFVEAIVPTVNLPEGWLEINPPEGLLELNIPSKNSEAKEKKVKQQQQLRENRKLRQKMSVARKRYTAAGQAHALAGLTEGEESQKTSFLDQLLDIDLRVLQQALDEALALESVGKSQEPLVIKPPEAFPKADWSTAHTWLLSEDGKTDLKSDQSNQTQRWFKTGLRQITEGQVAVLVLAGGQGSRLGPDAPPAKGMLNINLPSGKSLFQLQAERLRRVQILAEKAFGGEEARIPWIVMTSNATDEATQQFFSDNNFFGLDESQVWFIKQGNMPCVAAEATEEGRHKLLLDSPHSVAESPSGNGSLFETLHKSGAVERLESLGVKHVQVYAVDNALVKVADPVFYGFCHDRKADVGVKVVTKTTPDEAVGVLCLRQTKASSSRKGELSTVDDFYDVIEYSEMPESLRSARENDQEEGALMYRAAHICINSFSVDFLKELGKNKKFQLPFHAARKRIPFVEKDDSGQWEMMDPREPNGLKLERYIFDSFKYCSPEKIAILEVERSEEFAPVKNAPGKGVKDSSETARSLVLSYHEKIDKLGKGVLEDGQEDLDISHREISPLVSYGGE